MGVDQLPGRVREFANYLNGLLARLDQGAGWCAVFWQRDPDGMQACLDGREVPPWDVVEALLQDLAAEYGTPTAVQEADRARSLHAGALTAYDARPGGRDALGDRLDVMLREQRYAAERQAELGRLLAAAATQEDAEAIRLDLAWAHDDHERAVARCAELRYRMAELDRRAGEGQLGAAHPVRRPAPDPARGPQTPTAPGYGPAPTHGAATGPGQNPTTATGAPTYGPEGTRPGPGPGSSAYATEGSRPATGPGSSAYGTEGTRPGPGSSAYGTEGTRPGSGPGSSAYATEGSRPATGPGSSAYGTEGTRPGPGSSAYGTEGTRPGPGPGSSAYATEGSRPATGPGSSAYGTEGTRPGPGTSAYGTEGHHPAAAPGSSAYGSGAAAGPTVFAYDAEPQAGSRAGVAFGPEAAAPHPEPTSRWAPAAAPVEPPAPESARSAPVVPDLDTAPAPAPEKAAPLPKQRKRRRGSARFAGMAEEDDAPVVVPPAAEPVLPEPAAAPRRTLRGARFAGAAEQAERRPEPQREPLDVEARRETVQAVERLVALRGEGRSGEAHALLVELAYWPAARIPLLAAELQRAGLSADWTTLLWEAASLPADRLVEAADALVAVGRTADGEQILRQGVARPAGEIGQAVLGLVGAGRRREARALLDAYVRVRTPEEAARSATPDPATLVPLLLESARGISEQRHWDLVHALRVAGLTA